MHIGRKLDTMRYEQDVEHVESTLKLSQGDPRVKRKKERQNKTKHQHRILPEKGQLADRTTQG